MGQCGYFSKGGAMWASVGQCGLVWASVGQCGPMWASVGILVVATGSNIKC